jgi:F-box protein 18 (helicase)
VLNLYNGKPEKIKDKLIAGMKTMKELEDYIEKTEDNSLSMIVAVVKEFGNKLPSLINELKDNHTVAKEDADMIFSTVHRCKGMEYDEVTLLNDFVNEEKLKKYIAQYGGDKINERDKNRLSEEINILYVAATRAKSKLKIPQEINPLKSVELAQQPEAIFTSNKKYQRNSFTSDWDLSAQSYSNKNAKAGFTKNTNHGKRWTDEEEDEAAEFFSKGIPIKNIAKQLSRGINGVRIKLINMGLMEDEGNV